MDGYKKIDTNERVQYAIYRQTTKIPKMDMPISESEYVHKNSKHNHLTQQIYIINNP